MEVAYEGVWKTEGMSIERRGREARARAVVLKRSVRDDGDDIISIGTRCRSLTFSLLALELALVDRHPFPRGHQVRPL